MIKIDADFYMTHDSNQWTLVYEKTVKDKKGKDVLRSNRWYCGKLNRCLSVYVDERSKIGNSDNPKDANA